MRRPFGIIAVTLLLFLASSSPIAAKVQAERIVLDPSATETDPQLTILSEGSDHLTLELTLPALELEEFVVENEIFHALSFPNSGFRGETGQPALPTYSRLIALPAGAEVTARIVSHDIVSLAGYRVLPMQPDVSETFVIDRSHYSSSASAMSPEAQVGEAAQLRHMRVVPLSNFRP